MSIKPMMCHPILSQSRPTTVNSFTFVVNRGAESCLLRIYSEFAKNHLKSGDTKIGTVVGRGVRGVVPSNHCVYCVELHLFAPVTIK